MFGYNKVNAVVVKRFRVVTKDRTAFWFKWSIQRECDGTVTVWRRRADEPNVWDFMGICDTWKEAQHLASRLADQTRILLRDGGLTVQF